MSSPSEQEIQTLLNCLRTTFTASDKATREAAEKQLQTFQKDIIVFTRLLFEIIQSSDTSIDQATKMSIILHLNRTVSKSIVSNTIPQNQKIEIIKLYLNYLSLPNVPNKFLVNMSEGFESILTSTENEPKVLIELTGLILSNIGNVSLHSIKGMIMILEKIVTCEALTKLNFVKVIGEVFNISQAITQILIAQLDNAECSYEKNPSLFLYVNDSLANLFQLFFICVFKLKRKIHEAGLPKNEIQKAFNIFIPIGIQILFKNIKDNSIISWTGIKDLDNTINNLKVKIMKFINNTVLTLSDFINDEQTKKFHSEIIKRILVNMEYIINEKMKNIIYMSEEETTGDNEPTDLSNNYKYSLLISQMIIYLNRISTIETFKVELSSLYNNIFINIILPLLIITKRELEDCTDSSSYEDYAIDLEDILFHNKNKTIKSSIAAFLKTIYSNVKSSQLFICKYTLSLLLKTLGMEVDEISKNEVVVKDEDKVNVLLANDNAKKIDLCLLVLSILGECDEDTAENKQNLFLIQTVFEKTFKNLIDNSLPLHIRHKMIVFIKQFIFQFYIYTDEIFLVLVQYLFTAMLDVNQPLLSKEASEVLSEVLSECSKESKVLEPILNNFLPSIITQIQSSKLMNFFDVLLELRMKFTTPQLNAEIFANICQRVAKEIERKMRLKFKVTKDKNNKSKSAEPYDSQILINKMFNIIRSLTNDKDFVLNNLPIISTGVIPLFKYMENIKKIDFDEDLIQIMSNIINHLQCIPDMGYELLINLYKYPEKNGGMLLDVYELVNAYIVYGGKTIEQNQQYLKAMIDIFTVSINATKFTKSPFYICVLIQIWLMNSKTVPTEIVTHFVDTCIDKLNTLHTSIEKEKENYVDVSCNYMAYLVLLYVSCINYAPICLGELNKVNKMADLINWTNTIFNFDFVSSYQIKILVLSISNLINSNYFQKDCEVFLGFGFKLLEKQRKNESVELKKLLKKEINCNFITDSDDENDDEDNNSDEDDYDGLLGFDNKKELQDLIKHTINPMKEQDEFVIYKSAIENFKQNNSDGFQKWSQSLSSADRTKLTDIIEMKRITIKDRDLEYSIPRKIVKIKRRNNQPSQ